MTFEFYTFALLFMAGVCFYSGVHHCTLERLRTQCRLHLLFAGAAFLVTLLTLSQIPSSRANNIPDYIAFVRINFAFALLALAVLPWFFAEYTGQRPLPVLLGFTALFAILFLANLVQPNTILYRDIHGLRRVTLPWGEQFFMPISSAGIWSYLTLLTIYLSQAFCLYVLAASYRRNQRFTKLFMLIALVLFIASLSQGVLARFGIITQLPPLGMFGFHCMVIAMGAILVYEIKEDQRYLNTLLNNVPAQIFMLDIAGRFLSVNRHFELTFKCFMSECQGKSVYDMFPREQAEVLQGHNQEVFASHKPLHFEETITYNGETRSYSIIKVPLYDSAGASFAVCGIAMDITDRKQAETELEEYRNHLEELVGQRTTEMEVAKCAAEKANEARSRFLTNVSHEIRTPLNSVLGFSQLLEQDPSLSPQGCDRVKNIIKSGECLLSLINDVLAMSRIDAGCIELRTAPVDLNELFLDLDAIFRPRAEEQGLSFTCICAESIPRLITTDLGKLRQVLINLLGNAFKYTRHGSIALRAFSAGSDRIAIEVEDSGIGILPEELDDLFEPFVRSSNGDNATCGTGLGLAISREYVNLMGGEIVVTSSINTGSCFRFEFHAPAIITAPVSGTASRRVTGLAPGQGDIHVLIVDDNLDNSCLMRVMLEPLGFIVDEASGGSEAIEKACSRLPRIILMDMVMPVMDGAETTRRLRSIYPAESLTIIGVSASTFVDEKNYYFESGIDAFIAKPFLKQELFDTLALHAGVSFAIDEIITPKSAVKTIPTLKMMSAKWLNLFGRALSRGHITRLRHLAEEARKLDPLLSAYLIDLTNHYDLKTLKKLLSDHDPD
jgi:PAS domain S-box-containing protein